MVFRSTSEEAYHSRNKNEDTKILTQYLTFSAEQQINKILRTYFKRKDSVVINKNPEFGDP